MNRVAGWVVFAIATLVYFFSAEPTVSLWDCGEFIAGAYKLQVVHPPGAPLFLLVGRLFTWVASIFSNDPSAIAFSINFLSGVCTAFAAAFIAWSTGTLGRLAMVGRNVESDQNQNLALFASSVVAGLTAAFCSSVWFSAVEGEVYAMSTMFTAMVFWSVVQWYNAPDEPASDKWLIFAVYATALSIGVHLLSLLTFPALALFYYFKKHEKPHFTGAIVAALIGVGFIVAMQSLIITGIPKLWGNMELLMVNSFGLPYDSGFWATLLIIMAIGFFGFRLVNRTRNGLYQRILVGGFLSVIGFSTIGMVMIRAKANPPINMNSPSNPLEMIPYLNREQYGERPLLRGPNFDAKPIDVTEQDRYGRVNDRYEVVEKKVDYVFADEDKIVFPRMGDYSPDRNGLYKAWMNYLGIDNEKPTTMDNVKFMMSYQFGWMYWRYFMWNFAGRQNGEQGYLPWDKTSGHWLTGVKAYDSARLYNQDKLTPHMQKDHARNTYYMLPLIFGLVGLVWHLLRRRTDWFALMALFIITGFGIIIYSNQPPNEPRERDYVLVGSFITFAIWVGFGVLSIFEFLRKYTPARISAIIASLVVLSAPLIMGFQNFDDHSRAGHTGARDYASNFLESCAPNSIIFTYGDNDTYPLWYAQEVEGIRPDVRVANLSLIAVDWYIDQLRRKVNTSPPVKMTIPSSAYLGDQRNQVPYYNPSNVDQMMNIKDVVKFIGEKHELSSQGGKMIESYLPTKTMFIPVDKAKVLRNGDVAMKDSALIVPTINFKIKDNSLYKDDVAVLDILASNNWDRPIYFSVTAREEKLQGLNDYMQLEGLGFRLVPIKSESDPTYGFIGSGRVAPERVANSVNKWKWGNFDKKDLYVDRSYAPSIQSMRFVILRGAMGFLAEGKNDEAVKLVDQYFKGFPDMNFPYDVNAMYMINVYLAANQYAKAKPHMEILAKNTADLMKFYYSIRPSDLQSGFERDFMMSDKTKTDIIKAAEANKDAAFVAKLKTMFQPYEDSAQRVQNLQGARQP
jgi:hypothetical protein